MKTFRINAATLARSYPWDGVEFDVEDDATEEEIYDICWNGVAEYVDFGWEEVAP